MGGYPFRPTRSSQAMLNYRTCLDFDHPAFVIPGMTFVMPAMRTVREPAANSRHTAPEMTAQVSTSPVLEPLAAESLWPWGSAR